MISLDVEGIAGSVTNPGLAADPLNECDREKEVCNDQNYRKCFALSLPI